MIAPLLEGLAHGSLAQFCRAPVVAAPLQQTQEGQRRSTARPLELIQGSLSSRKADRQSPLLGNLHRIADGSLIGLGVAVLGLSGLTLHWQGQWTQNFQKLEAAQRLEHRLQESAAVLEQHHLGMTRKPALLEPTSSQKLVYLEPPAANPQPRLRTLLAQVNPRVILPGY
ncbi:hypothetical protein [Synechococcus sp. HK05]|uniref:hypothetical protein n=1 Tax=Synechococcus sp. HK05 TaxID=2725975 RepID=UPI0034CEF72D